MAKNNALCKELTIVEALGNANIICSDKTGTLTLNKMTVTTICNYDDIVEKNNRTPEYIKENIATYKHLVSIGMFCNNAEIDVQENTAIGDPTEIALLYLGENTDLNIDKTRNKYKRVFEQPFDSDRKMMTTVYATKTGYTSFTKGAAEAILDLCDSINTKDGIRDITTADRNLIKKYLNELSAKALRVLGLASRNFRSAPIKDSNYENQMVFEGLVGMIDPPRPEVFDAIKTCHEAGVGVAMITGDHQITALAIARELGIVDENETYTLTGTQLDEMSDNQLKIAVQKCRVFARVSPDNKLQIVKAFKSNNLITGMTGDGTNDAPALKEADIGIAMGIGGTDVAKGAASVLLLDDNFTTIKGAINDGRKITRNMKNVISFILATNLATALFVVLFTYIFGFNTITVTQRLLLDLVTDTLPCIYIGLNPNDFGLMKQKPQIGNKLFDKRMLFEILINFLAIFSAVSLSFIFSYYAVGIRSEVVLDMICFITLSLSRILLSLNYVSHHNSLLKKIGRPYNGLYFACGVSIGLLLILSFVPGANIIAVGKPTDMFEPAKLFYTKDAAA
jgi:Ca2+-transporting ATPase